MRLSIWRRTFAVFLCSWITSLEHTNAELSAYDLTCEHADNPVGIDTARPQFSWKLQSARPGERQTAWQILVAQSPEILGRDEGDLWNSGRIAGANQSFIRYEGSALRSLQTGFWKVRVWDSRGEMSRWSAPGQFTTGFLNDHDWRAGWIESPFTNNSVLFRREFVVMPGLKRAVAVVCGLGQFELAVNGEKSGRNLLSPGWTKYDRTCLYETHDVTTLLRAGTNAIGIELGGGIYRVLGGRYAKFTGSFGPLKTIAELSIEYSDGSVDRVVTDTTWRTQPGPITFSCVYGGEDFDARLEPQGWDRVGFNDSNWANAVTSKSPGGTLRGWSASAPPIQPSEILVPVSTNALSNGVAVYDLAQNASIMPRIRVRGPRGSTVRIIPAELVKADGSVDRGSVSLGRPGWWQYTLRGDRSEEWFPKFFYHGARYLQVHLLPAEPGGALPEIHRMEGQVVHSTSAPVGEFECSNDLFNRIHRLVRWAQRSNMASVLTDCPHRERLRWLEQYHLNGPSIRYEFDLNQLFTKGMNDMADCQLSNGCVPSIAPEFTVFGDGPEDVSNAFRNSPEWGSAIVLVPWQQYEFTGDLELARRHYESMKRYVAYLASTATNDIVSFGLGDWYDIGPKTPGFSQLTPIPLTATAFYYEVNRVMGEVARLLEHAEDAAVFDGNARRIRDTFNRKFFDPTNGFYGTGSQCANAIPLVMGLVEPSNRSRVLEALIADIRARTNSITAGDVGYRYVLRALAAAGRSDVIFDMNNQSERPGYGYQLRMGATSLTEAWNARRGSSQNHFMLGQIMEWFYRDLAGIGFSADRPGFAKVDIRPQPVGDVTWVRASYESVRGPIVSHWSREGDRFRLEISIPPNTTASVRLPGSRAKASGPRAYVRRLAGGTDAGDVFEVGSGAYSFESRLGR